MWILGIVASLVLSGTATEAQAGTGRRGLESFFPAFVERPRFTPDPGGVSPLSALVEVETDIPTRISLHVSDGYRTFLLPDAGPGYRRKHSLPVLGLKFGRNHEIRVVATSERGFQSSWRAFDFITPPIPQDFPPLEVSYASPDEMEPGYTFLGSLVTPPLASGEEAFSMMLDAEGDPVWFLIGTRGEDRTREGTMIGFNRNRSWMPEVDFLGNIVDQWYATSKVGPGNAPGGSTLVAADSFHHEFKRTPVGSGTDFVFLGSEERLYANYPSDLTDLSQTEPSAKVIGDVIYEITRDGTIVHEKRLLDILDPYRVGYGSLGDSFWGLFYGSPTRDWAHSNSVEINLEDDTYLVSVRHQDAIVKIRRSTPGTGSFSDLVWILGPHENWQSPWDSKLLTPVGAEFEWQYHQHAAQTLPNGDILCFDNGNHRTSPPTPYPNKDWWYSRAVEYRVDPDAMTVEQVWAAGGLYDYLYRVGNVTFVSNADRMPTTGNIFIDAGGSQDLSHTTAYTRLLEVTHTSPPQVVFDATIYDVTGVRSWVTYRSHRVPGLYPPTNRIATELHIDVGPVVTGAPVTIEVTGDVEEGDMVAVSFTRGASNSTRTLMGKSYVVGVAEIEHDGIGRLQTLPIPPGIEGAFSFQASELTGPTGRKSNLVTVLSGR